MTECIEDGPKWIKMGVDGNGVWKYFFSISKCKNEKKMFLIDLLVVGISALSQSLHFFYLHHNIKRKVSPFSLRKSM